MSLPVYLIGARGSGKTTVGQQLSQQLEYSFRDTDQHLQQRIGMSIADYVAQSGWDSFRLQESQSLQAVSAKATVVATGGGIILREENRQFMQQTGRVIWLNVDADILAQRLMASPEESQRPTLTGRPIAEEMYDILKQRAALYQMTAHHIISASRPPEQIVAEIIHLLNNEKE